MLTWGLEYMKILVKTDFQLLLAFYYVTIL